MAKPSRKELRRQANQDDAFVGAGERSAAWLAEHRGVLLGAVAAVLLAGLGTWGTQVWMAHRASAAASEFAAAWTIYEHGVVDPPAPAKGPEQAGDRASGKASDRAADEAAADAPHFPSEQARWEAALALAAPLQQGGGRLGALAALLVGELQGKLARPDDAARTYAELVGRLAPSDDVYFVAAERLAYLRERAGDRAGALAALAPLAADDKNFYADQAQLHQARLHLAAAEPEKARTVLQHMESAFPNSSLLDEARHQLQALPVAAAAAGTP